MLRAGYGEVQPDRDDPDVEDALLLSARDPSTGGLMWHWHSIEDVTVAISHRAWFLWVAFQEGRRLRDMPEWAWWRDRPTNVAHLAHLYPRSLGGRPEKRARCGYDPFAKKDPEFVQDDGWMKCSRCEAIVAGKPLGSGTIGGVAVRAGRPEGR